MRRLAVTIAVMGFFVLALVGWLSGCPTFTCAIRALLGAVALFVVVMVAGRILTKIMADAIVKSMPRGKRIGDSTGERRK